MQRWSPLGASLAIHPEVVAGGSGYAYDDAGRLSGYDDAGWLGVLRNHRKVERLGLTSGGDGG
jgi:hypothetical protein